MVTVREDLLQALMEAYLMEKGTREFYRIASEKALRPEAQSLFQELSLWEERHMTFIQFLHEALLDNRDIVTFEEFSSRAEAPVTESGVPVRELEKRMEGHEQAGEEEILRFALEMEGKAYSLYRGLSERTADQNARIVFREMMEQEKKHIAHLKGLDAKSGNVREEVDDGCY